MSKGRRFVAVTMILVAFALPATTLATVDSDGSGTDAEWSLTAAEELALTLVLQLGSQVPTGPRW